MCGLILGCEGGGMLLLMIWMGLVLLVRLVLFSVLVMFSVCDR